MNKIKGKIPKGGKSEIFEAAKEIREDNPNAYQGKNGWRSAVSDAGAEYREKFGTVQKPKPKISKTEQKAKRYLRKAEELSGKTFIAQKKA